MFAIFSFIENLAYFKIKVSIFTGEGGERRMLCHLLKMGQCLMHIENEFLKI